MTDINILMLDGCTRTEAEKHLKHGTVVFTAEDLESHFDDYMNEWGIDEDERRKYRKMIESKTPISDWGVVETKGYAYYIMYCL